MSNFAGHWPEGPPYFNPFLKLSFKSKSRKKWLNPYLILTLFNLKTLVCSSADWIHSYHALFFPISGTICVLVSFVFIFNPPVGGAHAEDWAKFIYYAPFVVIFQFGWATTQISHLSLIPELTACESERVGLNAIR